MIYLFFVSDGDDTRVFQNKRLALIMICITWIVAALVSCPPILVWREEDRWENTHECVLTGDPGYVIFSSLGSFSLPLLVMSFVYIRIVIVASRRNKRVISYRRKFYKYTGRSVSRTGSESQTTHEISGNISQLNGVRADCEETELSCDATALGGSCRRLKIAFCRFQSLSPLNHHTTWKLTQGQPDRLMVIPDIRHRVLANWRMI